MPSAVEQPLRFLSGTDVDRLLDGIQAVETVSAALALHADGRSTLPDEAYLPWHTTEGAFARSLALPGALWGDQPAIGMKIINSSLANRDHGLPRAQGLMLLFDRETARPVAVMTAAGISALRTAAYTMLSVRLLAPPVVSRIGIVGCGALAMAHIRLLAAELPGAEFVLYDIFPDRAAEIAAAVQGARTADSPEKVVRESDIVVTTTTTTTGYIHQEWLRPGALVAHVSLDDLLPEVITAADVLLVDDWALVSADDRRLLGRMYRAGQLTGPNGELFPGQQPGARQVDGTLADVIAGRHPGRTAPDQIVISNPFGMGILDVALAAEVFAVAEANEIGVLLPIS